MYEKILALSIFDKTSYHNNRGLRDTAISNDTHFRKTLNFEIDFDAISGSTTFF